MARNWLGVDIEGLGSVGLLRLGCRRLVHVGGIIQKSMTDIGKITLACVDDEECLYGHFPASLFLHEPGDLASRKHGCVLAFLRHSGSAILSCHERFGLFDVDELAPRPESRLVIIDFNSLSSLAKYD